MNPVLWVRILCIFWGIFVLFNAIIVGGRVARGFRHVNVGHLLSAPDVIEHDYAIVIQVDRVHENADNAAAEVGVKKIAVAKHFQPRNNVIFCIADSVYYAKLLARLQE